MTSGVPAFDEAVLNALFLEFDTVDAIATHTGLDSETVESTLERLRETGLATETAGKWRADPIPREPLESLRAWHDRVEVAHNAAVAEVERLWVLDGHQYPGPHTITEPYTNAYERRDELWAQLAHLNSRLTSGNEI